MKNRFLTFLVVFLLLSTGISANNDTNITNSTQEIIDLDINASANSTLDDIDLVTDNSSSDNTSIPLEENVTIPQENNSQDNTDEIEVSKKIPKIKLSEDEELEIKEDLKIQAEIELDQCAGDLNINNEYVRLNKSLTSEIDWQGDYSWTCFNINGHNVTIDCQGYSIVGNRSGDVFNINNDSITIKNCNVSNVSKALNFAAPHRNITFQNNNVSQYGDQWGLGFNLNGMTYSLFDNNIIEANNITNRTSIEMSNGHNNTFTNNIFKNSPAPGYNYYMMFLGDTGASEDNNISHNEFYNITVGIYIKEGYGNVISYNFFDTELNHRRDIYLDTNTNDNFIYRNTLRHNESVWDHGGNYWNLSSPIGGNNWTGCADVGFNCVDVAPEDGFCDNPFFIDGNGDANDSLPICSETPEDNESAFSNITISNYDNISYDNVLEINFTVESELPENVSEAGIEVCINLNNYSVYEAMEMFSGLDDIENVSVNWSGEVIKYNGVVVNYEIMFSGTTGAIEWDVISIEGFVNDDEFSLYYNSTYNTTDDTENIIIMDGLNESDGMNVFDPTLSTLNFTPVTFDCYGDDVNLTDAADLIGNSLVTEDVIADYNYTVFAFMEDTNETYYNELLGTNFSVMEEEQEFENFTFEINITDAPENFSFQASSSVSLYVNWGDGNSEMLADATALREHEYATNGTFYVSLGGTASKISFFEGTPTLLTDIMTPVSDGVTGITSAANMFKGCTNLSTFTAQGFFDNTSGGVSSFLNMFQDVSNFNEDLSNWNLSSATVMEGMFYGASSFNSNITEWNISEVTQIDSMFREATSFNQDISGWDTSSVSDIKRLFYDATSFNQNISGWDISGCSVLDHVFYGATSFDQDIGDWNISSVTSMVDMFEGVQLSTENYDAILMGWEEQTIQSGVNFDGGNSQYCLGEAARNNLTNASNLWVITDGGKNCTGIILITNATVNKTALNETVINGSTVQFIINITNTGDENFTLYELTDRFNKSFMNFTGSNVTPSDERYGDGEIEWEINLTVNETILIHVNFTTYQIGRVNNTADLDNGTAKINEDFAEIEIIEENFTAIALGTACLNHNDYFPGAATSPFQGPVNPDLRKTPDYFFADGDTIYMLANFTYNNTYGNCSELTVVANFTDVGGDENINADLNSSRLVGNLWYCIFNASDELNMTGIDLEGLFVTPKNVSFTATDGISSVTGTGRNAVVVNTSYAPPCGIDQPETCTIADFGGFGGSSTNFTTLAHNGNFFNFNGLTFDVVGQSRIMFLDNVSIARPQDMQGLLNFTAENLLVNGTIGINDTLYNGSNNRPDLTGVNAELTFYNITEQYGVYDPEIAKETFNGDTELDRFDVNDFNFNPTTGDLTLNITSFSRYVVEEDPFADAFEFDDNHSNATLISTDGTKQQHTFHKSGDVDYIKFDAKRGGVYVIETKDLVGDTDTNLTLYNTDGTTELENNDDIFIGGPSSRIEWTAPTTGIYFASVKDYDNTLYNGTYNVSVTEFAGLNFTLVNPVTNISVNKSRMFNFSVNVTCQEVNCTNITVYLDPKVEKPKIETSKESNNNLLDKIEELEDRNYEVNIKLKDQKIITTKKGKKINLEEERISILNNEDILSSIKEANIQVQDSVIASLGNNFILERQNKAINSMSGNIKKQGLIALANNENVVMVTEVEVYHINLDISVPHIGADDAWNTVYRTKNINGSGQTICVIDTGVNYSHMHFGNHGSYPNAKVLGGYDFVNADNDPMDDHSHGTHCAAIAASESNTYTGVAPEAKLIAIKACDAGGSCNDADIESGIDWCVNNASKYNISVISLSLGGGGPYQEYCDDASTLVQAINNANDLGITVAVAAGNDGFHFGVSSPACASGAITVSATNDDDETDTWTGTNGAYDYSGGYNRGELTDIYAPGRLIRAAINTGATGVKSGTSMSTPHVAGAAALINQYYNLHDDKSLHSDEIKEVLTDSGTPISDTWSGLTIPRLNLSSAITESVVKGVIPMNSGNPFYTTSQNPVRLNLTANESRILNWTVNATGYYGDYDFFVFANVSNEIDEPESEHLSITIANGAPSISELNISPDSPIANESLNCSGNYSDPNGDAESGSIIKWYNEGSLVLTGNATLHHSYFNGSQNITCEYTPSDGMDYGEAVNESVVILNSPPEFDPHLENKTVAENSAFIYNINCSDIDYDTLIYTSNSTEFTINSSTGLINWTPGFDDAGNITYNVTCSDSEGNQSDVFTLEITNTNRIPTISDVNITPDPAHKYDNLTCNGTYSDPDGQSESGSSFRWFRNGVLIVGETTKNLSNDNFNKTQNITCEYTPGDGVDNGLPVNGSIIISNDDPDFDHVIDNKTINENQTITYDFNCSDSDNDVLVYTSNSSEFTINSSTGLINWTPNFNQSGVYVYEITCSDGVLSDTKVWNLNVTDVPILIFDVTKTLVGSSVVLPDTTVSFNITIHHQQDGNLTTIYLNDTYNTSYLSYNGSSIAPMDPTDDGNIEFNITDTLGNLSVDSEFSFIINFTTEDNYTDETNNTVYVRAYSSKGLNDIEFDYDVLSIKNASISIDKDADTYGFSGNNIQYELNVSNSGALDLTNTTIIDVVPNGLTYVTGSNNTYVNVNGNVLTWNLTELNVSDYVILTYNVTVDADVKTVCVSNCTNTVNVTAYTPQNQTIDDEDSHELLINNSIPTLTQIPTQTITEDTSESVNISSYASDTDSEDTLTFHVTNYTSSEVVCSVNGDNISMVPEANYSGSANCTILVGDGTDNSTEVIFNITVTGVNDAPDVSLPTIPYTLVEDTTSTGINLSNFVSDSDHADIEINWSCEFNNSNVILEISNVTKLSNLSSSNNFTGLVSGNCTAYDPEGATDYGNLTVNVTPVNDAPVLDMSTLNVSVQEDSTNDTINLSDYAYDVDNNDAELNWSCTDNETDFITEAYNGSKLINLTATNNFTGNVLVNCTVFDSEYNDTDSFTVTVTGVNDAPTLSSIANQTIIEDTNGTVDVIANGNDVDGDPLTISITNQNTSEVACTVNGNNITMSPAANYTGDATCNVTVNDGVYDSNEIMINISVTAVNDAPVLDMSNLTVSLPEDSTNDTINLSDYAYDVDNTDAELNWSCTDNSTNFITEAYNNSKLINLTGINNFTGLVLVTCTVFDSEYNDSDTFVVNVTPVNDAPELDFNGLVYNITEDIVNSSLSLSHYAYDNDTVDAELNWSCYSNETDVTLSASNATKLLTITPSNNFTGLVEANCTVFDSEYNDYDVFTINVTNVNDAPAINSTAILTATQDVLYNYDVDALDEDPTNDVMNFSLTTSPTGMIINSTNGNITWTPDETQIGNNGVVVKVEDGNGGSDTQSFTISVNNTNDAPNITSIAVETATQGTPYNYDVNAIDPDEAYGDSITYSLALNPLGMSINNVTGVISWTPTNDDALALQKNVSVVAIDEYGLNDTQNFTINVSNINDAPVINTTPDTTATEDTQYSYDVNASDVDLALGDSLIFSLDLYPSGMNINTSSGNITWTPTDSQVGNHSIIVRVTDNASAFDTQSFNINVAGTNDNPIITSTPVENASNNTLYNYDVNAYDPENDTLNYSFVTNATGMIINSTTGLINWTPTNADVNHTYQVNVTVNDTNGGGVEQKFNITVFANITPGVQNQPPTINSTAILVATEDVLYQYNVTASDPENDTLTFSLMTGPGGMVINSNGTINWTPTNAQALAGSNTHSVTVRVNDTSDEIDQQTFTITVTNTNDNPVIGSVAVTAATEEVQYNYDVDATDEDGDGLTYSLTLNPTGMVINASSGNITWTPTNAQVGNHNVSVNVTDGNGGYDEQNYTITVANINDAPVIVSTPETTGVMGQVYSYQVNATDEDGDSLSYTLSTKPGTMSVNSSGYISWTADVAGNNSVTIVVNDGNGGSDNQSFTIDVDGDTDGDGIGDDEDTMSGNSSDVTLTGISSLNVTVGGSDNLSNVSTATGTANVKFNEGNATLIEFSFNFASGTVLNLSNVTIARVANTTSSTFTVNGLPAGITKSVYMNNTVVGAQSVCISDVDNASVSIDASACGAGETQVNCPGSSGAYTCAISGSFWKIGGLSHSAVKQSTSRKSTGNPSGGSSGGSTSVHKEIIPGECVESWVCDSWNSCEDGTQIRNCFDANACGTSNYKPQTTQTCGLEEEVSEETEESVEEIEEEVSKETVEETKEPVKEPLDINMWWIVLVMGILAGLVIHLIVYFKNRVY